MKAACRLACVLTTAMTPVATSDTRHDALPETPGARRARASSRSTWRRIAPALFSISSASSVSPFFRNARMSADSTCSGVLRPCARSVARDRARASAFSWASRRRLISSASGCTSLGAATSSRAARCAITFRTATRKFSSGARPTVIWMKNAAMRAAASRRRAGARSRTYSLTDTSTVRWSSATMARKDRPPASMIVRSTAMLSSPPGPLNSSTFRSSPPASGAGRTQRGVPQRP